MTKITPPPYSYQRKPFGPLKESDLPLVARLPHHYREILQQEGDMSQIAMRLAMPVGTIKSRLHRARAALSALREEQAHLQPETPPDN
jgi:hypothetical protein